MKNASDCGLVGLVGVPGLLYFTASGTEGMRPGFLLQPRFHIVVTPSAPTPAAARVEVVEEAKVEAPPPPPPPPVLATFSAVEQTIEVLKPGYPTVQCVVLSTLRHLLPGSRVTYNLRRVDHGTGCACTPTGSAAEAVEVGPGDGKTALVTVIAPLGHGDAVIVGSQQDAVVNVTDDTVDPESGLRALALRVTFPTACGRCHVLKATHGGSHLRCRRAAHPARTLPLRYPHRLPRHRTHNCAALQAVGRVGTRSCV